MGALCVIDFSGAVGSGRRLRSVVSCPPSPIECCLAGSLVRAFALRGLCTYNPVAHPTAHGFVGLFAALVFFYPVTDSWSRLLFSLHFFEVMFTRSSIESESALLFCARPNIPRFSVF